MTFSFALGFNWKFKSFSIDFLYRGGNSRQTCGKVTFSLHIHLSNFFLDGNTFFEYESVVSNTRISLLNSIWIDRLHFDCYIMVLLVLQYLQIGLLALRIACIGIFRFHCKNIIEFEEIHWHMEVVLGQFLGDVNAKRMKNTTITPRHTLLNLK